MRNSFARSHSRSHTYAQHYSGYLRHECVEEMAFLWLKIGSRTTRSRSFRFKTCREFYILLTVHHVMILGKWPTWCTVLFYVFIFIFNSLDVSNTSCSSSGETNCVNTTSGSCRWGRRPAHDTATDTEWQLPEVVLAQFVSPDDEHDVLETCRELKIKINT